MTVPGFLLVRLATRRCRFLFGLFLPFLDFRLKNVRSNDFSSGERGSSLMAVTRL